jgi:hypothetical protein
MHVDNVGHGKLTCYTGVHNCILIHW